MNAILRVNLLLGEVTALMVFFLPISLRTTPLESEGCEAFSSRNGRRPVTTS